MTASPLVRIDGLTKSFGEGETRVDAVRGLDLALERGEIVLVMGPSGSGKTTFLSMLGALLRVTSGAIWIDGTNIAALGERELPPIRARMFGFIFQDFNLVVALSARENVEIALNIAGTKGAAARERATRLLESMGLGERLDFSVEKLSGGEKQRVAIARAIANTPALVLADEPTANLDSHNGAETMRLLRDLAKKEGTTVVIVSHDERLREIADRVLWLEDGQLKTLNALVRDPVCGMLIDPANAPASIREDGTTLSFCSRGCRDEYLVSNTPKGYTGWRREETER
jgi:putative ABC transport system ATP-binding protein